MERIFHLTSGELAELVGVTKQTVLYYDKVGLLCPKGRMSNRYRYYSLQQAAELRLILTFRELGMSIQEIRDYLQVRTPEAYLQVLGEQQERLQAEAARLQRMQERIARERRQLSQAMAAGGGSICLCCLPAQELLRVQCREQSKREYMGFLQLSRRSRAQGEGFSREVYCILPQEHLQAGDFEHIYGYAVAADTDAAQEDPLYFLRPAGVYAVLYHWGTYGTLSPTYANMAAWIEAKGYRICGDAYEKSLFNTLTGEEHGMYVNEIAIQVEKRPEAAAEN